MCIFLVREKSLIVILFGFFLILQRLHCELPNAIMRIITDSGHLPHVDNPASVSKLITDFVLHDSC